jgi:CheY-like chemotaxis protein
VSKRTLLLADDSVTIQKVVNLTFADEGIDVITVGDGDSAMEKISQISPDVVLADVHMPGLSGYQICEILRQNPVTREMPVVLLVGSFEPFDESEAARVGANAYLTKPFQSIRQLVSQVTELMDASEAKSEDMGAATEPSAAAPEPEKESPDLDDIESLYHQSFGEPSTSDVDAEGEAAPRYVDAGMDDEMIETSSAGLTDDASYDSQPDYSPHEVDGPGEFVPASVTATSDQASFESAEQASHFGQADRLEQTQASVGSTGQQSEFAEADRLEQTQEFESFVDDQGEISDAALLTSHQGREFDDFSNTDASLGTQAPSNQFAQDDTDILELPPIDNGKTLEFTTTQRIRAESAAKELVSLSPELMDVLVQKVVEKLSEK